MKKNIQILLILSLILNAFLIYLKPEVLTLNFNKLNEYTITNNSDVVISHIIIGYKTKDNKEEDVILISDINKAVVTGKINISKMDAKDIYVKYNINKFPGFRVIVEDLHIKNNIEIKKDFKINITINSVDDKNNINATITTENPSLNL